MKTKTIYTCSNCGSRSPRWAGRCFSCGAWDSYVAETNIEIKKKNSKKIDTTASIKTLGEIELEDQYRLKTGIGELDRVLGGGIVPGSLILIGGDPGIGKSTLMLNMCSNLDIAAPLYISGEESLEQIKMRANRLNGDYDSIKVSSENSLENIIYSISQSESSVIIIDSIQSIYSEEIDAAPGTLIQVRECAGKLMRQAKDSGKAIFLVGHVTKDGAIAGPKVLEHIVDVVLQFEGEKTYSYRILRSLKNRYGSTNEIGIFEMTDSGLKEVENPSELFLVKRSHKDSGVAVCASIEGSRPILLEVQALASPTGYSVPQRTSTGFDLRRLQMILAVLEKRLSEKFKQMDIFVNIAGGVYLNDTAADLALAAALISSRKDNSVLSKTALAGEIGLTGEVRPIAAVEQRISESEKLGFERIIIPPVRNIEIFKEKYKIEIICLERLSLLYQLIF